VGVDVNGWPDSDKPGYPLDPETDGWHWLANSRNLPCPWMWFAETCEWGHAQGDMVSLETMSNAKYLGPALTPAEVEDMVMMLGEAAAHAVNELLAATQTDGETKH
jgi:hypothetical protein